jgi:hypothetical protein
MTFLPGTDFFDMMLGFELHAHGFDSLRLNFQPRGGSNPWLKCAALHPSINPCID